ncbi:Neutral/alkaline non-lysosomal ceramidase, N-terminal [Devosia enhydra]|uniref:Neutral/alkaline non-lysosomal ceramidase, N-terminal n=1 Tax=Devosia enhydra TaxID=665118 RepID=A0A1K2I262_9HYPH|nr:neutral/alkaline non-lysosomal ceramidase N-terminal domain-containing protein [Devosia enhydra]SFZ86335.1 Neutral/alkaline non-lysosomal ceramidase, N-terminal [Devosia enhydra]
MSTLRVGAALVDITPPAGLAMAGFAARSEPATGAHDALTVRALVVEETALVIVDVLGLDRTTIGAMKARAALPAENIVIAALHTHGGPQTLVGRFIPGLDAAYMQRLEDAVVRAISDALTARRPAVMSFGSGADPGVAKNRRHPGGLTDPHLPVLSFTGTDGSPIATLVAHACHPVVLGADNRLWTADYPGVTRARIEVARPGTMAIFATGCTGDANTGHSAYASWTLSASNTRTFDAADRIGTAVAEKALAAPLGLHAATGASIARRTVPLGFARRETETMDALAARWRAESEAGDAARKALLSGWIAWAERGLPDDLATCRLDVEIAALRWGDIEIVALPGEIFAETAHTVRALIGNPDAIVIGFADDNPGYIPPASEFPFGGYEVDDAHRYYGQPATFAPGSAEALAEAAADAVRELRGRSKA